MCVAILFNINIFLRSKLLGVLQMLKQKKGKRKAPEGDKCHNMAEHCWPMHVLAARQRSTTYAFAPLYNRANLCALGQSRGFLYLGTRTCIEACGPLGVYFRKRKNPSMGREGGGTNRSDKGLNLSGSWQQGHSATYNTPSRI